ncbi:serine/threonine-protein kinase unc-51-like [Babylonia areolata]|uniref:serine/threonine-protein kinase unc-51-like n=1 Tax=Babylonia areolata TaxID=304850 RepID=UPI003FD07B3B
MASRRKVESIGDYCYDKKEILGHGAFAIVFKGFKKQTPSIPVAVKCIAKKELSKSKELLAKEIRVLREISVYQHENVVALLDVKETDSSVFLMIEFCNGGDLADYLHSKGTLAEDTLSSFMQQIASALNALNDKDIVHRDMKPQNILICYPKGGSKLSTPPTQLQLKIADFGFARFLEEGKMAGTLCGSPMYMAPEVIMSHKYDSKADLWSVGTIMFQCLTGKAPFVANTPQQLRAFYEKNVDLKPKIPENTSPELKDMLLRLLTRDASRRIGIKDLLQHPFLKKFKRSPSKRGSSSSPSPIPSRRRTPSVSSDSSTPGSTREMSPLARQMAVDPDKDMVTTLTSSRDDECSFTKVENGDEPRRVSEEGFVMVSKDVPEYKRSGEKKGKTVRAPLAVEEYDAVDESVHNSVKPINLNTGEGKATFHRKDEPPPPPPPPQQQQQQQQRQPSPTKAPPLPPRVSSPQVQAPSSPAPPPSSSSSPVAQRSGCSSTTAPIPVPSLTRTSSLSQQLRQKDGGSPKAGSPGRGKKRPTSSGSIDRVYQGAAEKPVERASSEAGLAAPDITQVSPPDVQFTIGTPPNNPGIWKRTSSFGSSSSPRPDVAAPGSPSAGSPLRRSASASPAAAVLACGGSGAFHPPTTTTTTGCGSGVGVTHAHTHTHTLTHSPLTVVPGSPTQPCPNPPSFHPPPPASSAVVVPGVQDRCRLQDMRYHRYSSSTETAGVCGSQTRREGGMREPGMEPCHRCCTEPDLRSQPFHSQHMLRHAYATHQQPAAGSRERLSSQSCDKGRGSSPSSMEQERIISSSPRQTGGLKELSPYLTMQFTASPPKFDNVPFTAPELSEDTLMDDNHNQTMAKLSFILDVVECVMDLARSKAAATSSSMANSSASARWEENLLPSQIPRFSESQKLLEQLVLYLRALQMMGQSIGLAEHEMKEDRLQYVNSLKNVLHQQHELYMSCIEECRKLYQQLGSICKTPLTPQLVVNTADKLIYNYAVEQCQAAALDEVSGNSKECFQRYTTAQVLLHSLAQMTRNDHDKLLLEKYRRSVEMRLHNIGLASMQYPCDSCS